MANRYNNVDLLVWKRKQEQQREREQVDNRLPLYVPEYEPPKAKQEKT